MPTHRTRNDLPSNARSAVIALLNARLADSIDLALLTKQAHWNLRGPNFISVHEMLDPLRAELDTHVDTMAERIVQLGGVALGTTQSVAAGSALAAYPTDLVAISDHLHALIDRYATVAASVRQGIDASDEVGDKDTADILTGYSRALDKALWFLEAHQG